MTQTNHGPAGDPSSVENLFAERFSQAIAQRGLALHRIQDRLEAANLRVSVATLSYWASGRSRPTRSRSQQVVPVLEQVLEVPRGWLTDALPAERAGLDVGGMLSQRDKLRATLERMGMPPAGGWKRLMVHRTTVVGPDRRERVATTSQVSRAEANGLDRWTVVMDPDGDVEVHAEAVRGLSVARTMRVPGTTTSIAEMVLPRRLQRGECIHTEHRFSYSGEPAEATHSGFAVTRNTDLLVMEVLFECEPPSHVVRCYRDGEGHLEDVHQSVVHEAHRVHCVVPAAVPGLHSLSWQW